MSVFQQAHQNAVKKGQCPCCGAETVSNTVEFLQMDDEHYEPGRQLHKVTCEECNSVWKEVFELREVVLLQIDGKVL